MLLVRPTVSAASIPVCKPGKTIILKGSLPTTKEGSYKLLPFKVAMGVSKLTFSYGYTGEGNVLDLAVWDNAGAFTYEGFRGWSGSRQGRSDDSDGDGKPDQPPVVIQAQKASRNYLPEKIRPGRWNVELGGGTIGSDGTTYKVKVKCSKVRAGQTPAADPVDKEHVADPLSGWFFGDFHMHAYHSNLNAPTQEEFVDFARAAKLDFFPITEYQINRHWNEWGQTSAANPDVLFWPGREVITYFGHAGILGETPGMIDYRHGFKDISMREIQQASVERGALFQINHPTTFPAPLDDLCRGCAWELDDVVDFDSVHTIEVVNVGVRRPGDGFPNPFVESAIEYWESKIQEGFHIAPVAGSDDKLGPNYGVPATAVFASELSRSALKTAIDAGHVWIAARGVDDSPHIDLKATSEGQTAIFGDTLASSSATFEATVKNGTGHTLWIYRDGEVVGTVPITSDEFTHEFAGVAATTDNRLGSYYRIETRETTTADPQAPGLLITLGMPIFLLP